MNDNYLWDRTGEPDDEVQKLEELLGTLRYHPKPLQIPPSLRIAAKRSYSWLAIAAAVVVLVLGASIWIRVRRIQPATPVEAMRDSRVAPPIEPDRVAVNNRRPAPNVARNPRSVASATIHNARVRREEPQLSAEELVQKEQLITALRLVSAKLNLAQRKSQGLPSANNIRNQHKIG